MRARPRLPAQNRPGLPGEQTADGLTGHVARTLWEPHEQELEAFEWQVAWQIVPAEAELQLFWPWQASLAQRC